MFSSIKASGKKAASGALAVFLVASLAAASLSSQAAAATITELPSNSAAYIPKSSALLKLGFSNGTITWGSNITHTLKSTANGEFKTLCVSRPSSTTTTTTLNNVCSIKYTNAATIGKKSIDVTIKVEQLVISPRYAATTENEDSKWMGFMYLKSANTAFGSSGSTSIPYAYRAQLRLKIGMSITWSGTTTTVNLPFFMAVNDIDTPITSSTHYGECCEAWQTISGFTGTYYTFPSCTLAIANNKFSACDSANQSGTDSWYRGGVIAPLAKSSAECYYYECNCVTGLSVYSSYLTLQNPTKSVDTSHSYEYGDTVSYSITQKIGTYREDTYTAYQSFTMKDVIPTGLSYQNMKIESVSGSTVTDLTSSCTKSYTSATKTATFSLPSSWLSNLSNYTGSTIRWTLVCKAEQLQAPRTTVTNQSTTLIDQMEYDSNTVDITVEGPRLLTVTKRIKASDVLWEHGEPSFIYKVVQGGKTYWGMISFTKASKEDGSGYLSAQYVFTNLSKASCTVEEMPTSRYVLSDISGDGTASSGVASLDLKSLVQGNVTFTNEKTVNSHLSDSHAVINCFGQES